MKRGDPQLGKLIFEPEVGWWEGQVKLSSGFVFDLYVHTPSASDQSITDAARATFEKTKCLEQTAREFAAEKLLTTHNEEWSDGTTITAEDFIRRLVPEAIQLWPNGDAEILFGDGNLFWGHEIGVRYRGGQFTEAVLQG